MYEIGPRGGACDHLTYSLDSLVSDDKELQRSAFVSRSLERLALLVFEVTPPLNEDWDEDELESISSLLEVNMIFLFTWRDIHQNNRRPR